MTMQLPLPKGRQATLISAYAPTMTNPEDVKEKFYEELDALLSSVHRTDKLILLGDFNARVGCDSTAWEGVIGKNGVDKCNSNGLLLLKPVLHTTF
jgi:exonuclease III